MTVYIIVSSFSSHSKRCFGAIYLPLTNALCWSKLCALSVELLSISQFVLYANHTVPSGCRQRRGGFGFSWGVYVPAPLRTLCRCIWEISLWLGVLLTGLASPDGELSETRSCRGTIDFKLFLQKFVQYFSRVFWCHGTRLTGWFFFHIITTV